VISPRTDQWEEHFHVHNIGIEGITPTGRATAWLLQMNCVERMDLRRELMAMGLWPRPHVG
jgi:hypothetical protein